MWYLLGSLSGIQLTSRLLGRLQAASVTCRVPWWGQLEAGHNRTLPPLHVFSESPHVSLQQGHQTSYTMAQSFKTKSSKRMEAETAQPLKGWDQNQYGTTSMAFYWWKRSQVIPGLQAREKEPISPWWNVRKFAVILHNLQMWTHKKLGIGAGED